MPSVTFAHPEPARPPRRRSTRIWPVFFPYMGCPGRCVFCAQHLQSGASPRAPAAIYETFEADILAAAKEGRGPYEIGFYGGAFTALPAPWPERFAALAGRLKARGVVSRARCSTRPDAAAPALLSRLASLGLDMVELGAQTFEEGVLAKSGRNHGAEAIALACRAVRGAGLALGLQLLPGLPGHTRSGFDRDVERAIALGPECVRIYPCLVVAGTRLADMLDQGLYAPWGLPETVASLSRATLAFWDAGIRVTRLGLAPQPELDAAILAGPRHPALGTSVRARALYLRIKEFVEAGGGRALSLIAPARYNGEFWGHARELVVDYAAIGLPPDCTRFENRSDFLLETVSSLTTPDGFGVGTRTLGVLGVSKNTL